MEHKTISDACVHITEALWAEGGGKQVKIGFPSRENKAETFCSKEDLLRALLFEAFAFGKVCVWTQEEAPMEVEEAG